MNGSNNRYFKRVPLSPRKIRKTDADANSLALQEAPSTNKLTLTGLDSISLPAQIWGFKQLTTLNLSHNALTYLPDNIGLLGSLKTLLLSNNLLTTLPTTIHKLSQLKDLSLTENRLSSLPETMSQLSALRSLDLSFNSDLNKLTSTTPSIGRARIWPQLTFLNIVETELLQDTSLSQFIANSSCQIQLSSEQYDALADQPSHPNHALLDNEYNPFN